MASALHFNNIPFTLFSSDDDSSIQKDLSAAEHTSSWNKSVLEDPLSYYLQKVFIVWGSEKFLEDLFGKVSFAGEILVYAQKKNLSREPYGEY